MKVIVIGGNPAGLSAASAIRRTHGDWDITVYEKDRYISYGSCGIPYYVAGEVKSLNRLITLTKADLEKKRKIPVYLFHEVIKVDFQEKLVTLKNLEKDEEYKKGYDYLIITTGGKSKTPDYANIKHDRLFKVHTLNDAKILKQTLEDKNNQINNVVIIGGGYIGVEMVEAYLAQGINDITVIGPRLVFKSSTQEKIKDEFDKHDIKTFINSRVVKIEPITPNSLKIFLDNGQTLDSDLVQLSIGVVPATEMFNGTELKMLKNGAIITDEYMKTNIENVYAAGDCATSFHLLLEKNVYIPLAPTANKQGRIAGSHIAGKKVDPFPGVIGTSIFKVLNLYCARTGITEEQAESMGYTIHTTQIENNEIAHYYPGAEKMSLSLIFDTKSHLLLGAEITAPSALGAKKIDVLATAIHAKMKIEDIQKLDLSYAPPFAPVWDPILIAANVARKKCE
ncbi:MAG: FAD-dependent oxidoreductase [Candidatus Hodarchaeales archaeon]|jgi:NADPH-dependent 2,4-dienoyl-CoA reductase/sulfur reductase-like enzyme